MKRYSMRINFFWDDEDDINRKLLAEDRYLVTGVEDGWIKVNEKIQKQYLESKERLERMKL